MFRCVHVWARTTRTLHLEGRGCLSVSGPACLGAQPLLTEAQTEEGTGQCLSDAIELPSWGLVQNIGGLLALPHFPSLRLPNALRFDPLMLCPPSPPPISSLLWAPGGWLRPTRVTQTWPTRLTKPDGSRSHPAAECAGRAVTRTALKLRRQRETGPGLLS